MSAIVKPAGYIGDFMEDATLTFQFNTFRFSSGASFTLAGTPAISVFKEGDATQVTTGVTLTADYDSITGLNNVVIVLTDAFYATGKDYYAFISAGTVDSVSVVGAVVAHFSIENRKVILADGKAHGGSTASLRLGSSSSTPAFYVTNSGGAATKFETTGSQGHAFHCLGHGNGMWIEGGDGFSAGMFLAHFNGGPGIEIYGGAANVAGLDIYGGASGTAHGIQVTAQGNGSGINAVGAGTGRGMIATGGATGQGMELVGGGTSGDALKATTTSGHGFNITCAGSGKHDISLGGSGAISGDFAAFTETYAADGATVKLSQALYEILSFLEERAISGTTMTCKKRDGSTSSMTFTLNSATAPTTVTRAT